MKAEENLLIGFKMKGFSWNKRMTERRKTAGKGGKKLGERFLLYERQEVVPTQCPKAYLSHSQNLRSE